MPEMHRGFSSRQIQMMHAARPLAQLVADETLGYDVRAGKSRDLVWPGIARGAGRHIKLEAPETTARQNFGDIWRPQLPSSHYTPYHQLGVISTGTITIHNPTRRRYDIYHTSIIDRPGDQRLHNMGIVVMQSLQLEPPLEPATADGGQYAEIITPHHVSRCRMADVERIQALITTIHSAIDLEATNNG